MHYCWTRTGVHFWVIHGKNVLFLLIQPMCYTLYSVLYRQSDIAGCMPGLHQKGFCKRTNNHVDNFFFFFLSSKTVGTHLYLRGIYVLTNLYLCGQFLGYSRHIVFKRSTLSVIIYISLISFSQQWHYTQTLLSTK